MSEKKFNIVATKNDIGLRLDLFLSFSQSDFSRMEIKNLLNGGNVFVNKKIEYRPHYKIKEGDEIEFFYEQKQVQPLKIMPENRKLDIVYEDQDLLVVNKDAGIVVHPATGNLSGTLMNAILFYNSKLSNVGGGRRLGLINRIDKDTSGLVLISKTNKGLWYYSRLFAERKVKKIYIAIVAGKFSASFSAKYTVTNYLGRNKLNRKKYCSVTPENGRLAETEFILIREIDIDGKSYSVIKACPKTGRTHQIRVHLSELNYPILGDVIYGKKQKYKRLMLHAWKAQLPLLNNHTKTFEATIPEEFKKFLN